MQIAALRLRPAEPRDEGFLREVYADSRREELARAPWPDDIRAKFLNMQFDAQAAHYQQHYPGAEFDVIEHEDQPIGRLYVYRTANEIRIMDIAILSEARGQGLGTHLLSRILAEGQAAGKKVSIHVEQFNPALRLYERLGFSRVEERGVYWLMEKSPV